MSKTLAILLCLFLLGCEKRAADPELEAVKKWLLSEEGQYQVVDQGNSVFPVEPVTIDQLVPCENWIVKRAWIEEENIPGPVNQLEVEIFAIFVKEKAVNRGWLLILRLFDDGDLATSPSVVEGDDANTMAEGLVPFGHSVTESEFRDFGDPVSLEKVGDFKNRRRKAARRSGTLESTK
ncbi:MAG: hypothetical protein AAF514_05775 [Verrucomicrobiota bacterium]